MRPSSADVNRERRPDGCHFIIKKWRDGRVEGVALFAIHGFHLLFLFAMMGPFLGTSVLVRCGFSGRFTREENGEASSLPFSVWLKLGYRSSSRC